MPENESRATLIPHTRYGLLVGLAPDPYEDDEDDRWEHGSKAARWPEPDPSHDLEDWYG